MSHQFADITEDIYACISAFPLRTSGEIAHLTMWHKDDVESALSDLLQQHRVTAETIGPYSAEPLYCIARSESTG